MSVPIAIFVLSCCASVLAEPEDIEYMHGYPSTTTHAEPSYAPEYSYCVSNPGRCQPAVMFSECYRCVVSPNCRIRCQRRYSCRKCLTPGCWGPGRIAVRHNAKTTTPRNVTRSTDQNKPISTKTTVSSKPDSHASNKSQTDREKSIPITLQVESNATQTITIGNLRIVCVWTLKVLPLSQITNSTSKESNGTIDTSPSPTPEEKSTTVQDNIQSSLSSTPSGMSTSPFNIGEGEETSMSKDKTSSTAIPPTDWTTPSTMTSDSEINGSTSVRGGLSSTPPSNATVSSQPDNHLSNASQTPRKKSNTKTVEVETNSTQIITIGNLRLVSILSLKVLPLVENTNYTLKELIESGKTSPPSQHYQTSSGTSPYSLTEETSGEGDCQNNDSAKTTSTKENTPPHIGLHLTQSTSADTTLSTTPSNYQ